MADEKWITRINALLAKAESTDSPEEAQACTEAAQRLMMKHSIDSAMLGKDDADMMVEELQLHHTKAFSTRLITFLIHPTVRAMGTCRMFLVKGQPKRFWLVGRPDDILATRRMLESLVAQGLGQMKVWANLDPFISSLPRQEALAAKGQFLITFGMTVAGRVEELFREVTSETTGSELVLANRLHKVDAFLGQQGFATSTRRAPSFRGSAMGRAEGRAAGLRANLGNSITH